MELKIDRVRPEPTSLTLVDMAPEPVMVYIMLDALYEQQTSHPEEVMDVIDYLEGRLTDYELPYTREEYEERFVSPENTRWKRVALKHTVKEQ